MVGLMSMFILILVESILSMEKMTQPVSHLKNCAT